MRKPAFCICENKGADQLRGNRVVDKHLSFCYIDTTIPLTPKPEISSFKLSSEAVQLSLRRTWSEAQKTDSVVTRLILYKKKKEPRREKTSNVDSDQV